MPVLAVAGAVVCARAAGAGAPFVASSALLQVIGIQIVTGAVGEELGWRGFLLSRLGARAGMLPAAWIMGLLWALWHVPAFFDPSLPRYPGDRHDTQAACRRRTCSDSCAPKRLGRSLSGTRPAQNEPGTGQEPFTSVVTSNSIEKLCGSVVAGSVE